MEKTVCVNIGSMGFTLDTEAYNLLNNYYKDIRSRVDKCNEQPFMENIEGRTAEILKEKLLFSLQVVDIDMIKHTISLIGNPEQFGSRKYDPSLNRQCNTKTADTMEPKKLYRSAKNKMLGGVCGGIAEYFNVDPTVIRLLFVFLVLFGGMGILAYIILWIVVPINQEITNSTN